MNKYIYEESRTKVPEYVYFMLTEKCPLSCPQCYNSSGGLKEMPISIFEDNLEQVKNIGIRKIALIGGEVLVHSRIEEILEKIEKSELLCSFSTSGYNIESVVNILKNAKKIYPIISLNASTKEIDAITRDGYEYSIKAMEILRKNDISFSVNWVAHHSNINNFYDFLNMVFKKGAETVSILQNKTTKEGEIVDNINLNDIEKLKKIISNSPYKSRIRVDRCSRIFQKKLFDLSEQKVGMGCLAGEFSMAINVEGKYQPCQHLNVVANSNNIKDAWINSEDFKRIRRNKKPCVAEII